MTDKLNPTKGKWKVAACTHMVSLSIYADKTPICSIDNQGVFNARESHYKEVLDNANLIAGAGTVYSETNLTPHQLLEQLTEVRKQRDELLAICKSFNHWVETQAPNFPREKGFVDMTLLHMEAKIAISRAEALQDKEGGE